MHGIDKHEKKNYNYKNIPQIEPKKMIRLFLVP